MDALFVGVLFLLFFYLGFGHVFFNGPKGIHFMRQTDSLSFASNFYRNSFDFFNPQLFNLKNDAGHAACEFPITYYLAAISYTIVGNKLFVLKFIHFILVYVGLFHAFKLSFLLLKDYVFSFLIGLTLFTATIFNYYSFNYLPDAAAFGLTLSGLYFVFKYFKNENIKTLIIAFSYFTFAGLIKITYLTYPLAFLIVAFLLLLFKKNELLSKKNAIRIFLYGSISLFLVLAWNAYMLYYNQKFHVSSFNTAPQPIWEMTNENIKIVWDHLSEYWFSSYFANDVFHFILLVIVFQIIFIKKASIDLLFFVLILFLGNLAYLLLFFAQFKDHDYYFITFYPFFIILLISGINTIQRSSFQKIGTFVLKIIFIYVVINGIRFSKVELSNRFNLGIDDYSKAGLLIEKNKNAIKQLNLPDDSKFIIAPDLCQNGGLFFLNKSGWTIENTADISPESISYFKKEGADYLLLVSADQELIGESASYGNVILKTSDITILKLN